MIQRIQTVYLLVAAIAAGLLFVVPIAHFSSPAGELVYTALTIKSLNEAAETVNASTWPVAALSALSALICLVMIFLYKNRPAQLRIGKAAFLVVTALLAGTIFFLDDGRTLAGGAEQASVSYGVGLGLPLVTLVLMWLANRAIKKDEDLVRSVDRLR